MNTLVAERVDIDKAVETAATKVAIVGATGYAGEELTAIIGRHPHARLVGAFDSKFTVEALLETKAEVAFLAIPNEASAHIAPQLLDAGVRVIDLSGAFRLREADLYPTW